jgi:sugar/nucleoside kinase (ribokinase family)
MNSKPLPLDLLVIGGASLDVYHLSNGQIVHSPGGAGLYTALAAACSGVRTGMFAPRPDPIPEALRAADERVDWIGPSVPLDQLPRFEIAHYGGGRAALLNASWGGEMLITPETFPGEQIAAFVMHIAALRTAERQLNFAKDFRSFRNFGSLTRLSAGTYSKICISEPDTVRELIGLCDFFFMNENEANLLFGGVDQVTAQPGQIIFVTLAERGALVIQGDHVTHVPGHPANEFDPTGAGDTFCGAALANIARGVHPVMAAQAAVLLSAEMIGAVGPTRLLSADPAPTPTIDPRVRVDADQVQRIAQLIAYLPDVQPFRFVGDFFPYADDPGALDWFFAVTLQQFGFWEISPRLVGESHGEASHGPGVRAYSHPMIASLDGRSLKGSDYLFAAHRRMIDRDGGFFTPDRQAALTADELAAVLRADDGSNPMPAFHLHVQLAQSYGRDMLALGWTSRDLVEQANRAAAPRTAFLSMLDHIGGYKEDPLRKKAMLLALILEQRPEKFLRAPLASLRATQERSNLLVDAEIASSHSSTPPLHGSAQSAPRNDAEPPVIDYHLMRSCLRTGLVEVINDDLRRRLMGREELSGGEEWAVRFAAYQAIQQVQSLSGRSMGAVDWFFFNARRRCPEMTEPDCPNCAIDAACAHRKELFQPVIRTTFY